MERLKKFDIIAPLPEKTGISVLERFGQFPQHRQKDLETMVNLVLEQFPEYKTAVERYLYHDEEYYGNLYIMRRKILDEYFNWLFPLLKRFDDTVTDQLPRTPGYLAERLFGIWFTRQIELQKYRCGWCTRAHFYGYDDATHHFYRNMILNYFLPPGSKRRFFMRKFSKRVVI
ncbi:hypothetical protein DSECCO2_661760 [anaerobic digester metagenome]